MPYPNLDLQKIGNVHRKNLRTCTIKTPPPRTWRIWRLHIAAEVYDESVALSLRTPEDYLQLIDSAGPPDGRPPFEIEIRDVQAVEESCVIERIFQQKLLNWIKLYRCLSLATREVVDDKGIPRREGNHGDFYIEIVPCSDEELSDAGGRCFRFTQMAHNSVEGAFARWRDSIQWDDTVAPLPSMAMVLYLPSREGLPEKEGTLLSVLRSFYPMIDKMFGRLSMPRLRGKDQARQDGSSSWELKVTAEWIDQGREYIQGDRDLSFQLAGDGGKLELGNHDLRGILPSGMKPHFKMIPRQWLVLSTRRGDLFASLPDGWRHPHAFSVARGGVVKRTSSDAGPVAMSAGEQVILSHSDPGCPFRFRVECRRR